MTPERTIIIRAVEPARKKSKVDIHALIAGITPANLPDVSMFETAPIGTEVW